MKFLPKFRGFSSLGDWLKIPAIRWIQTAILGGHTSSANLTALLSALAGTFGLLHKWDALERVENRKLLAITTFLAALGSLLLGILVQQDSLTWLGMTIISALVSLSRSISKSHENRYSVEVAGAEQTEMAYQTAISEMGARAIAGALLAVIVIAGSWWWFYFDSLTFLPVILFYIYYTPTFFPTQKGNDRKALGPWEGLRILRTYTDLRHKMTALAVSASFGGLFSYVPEILSGRFHGSSSDFGVWIGLTGAAGVVGAFLGNTFNKRRPFSTGTIYLLYALAASAGIYSGLANSWLSFTIGYMLFIVFQLMAFPAVDGLLRLVPSEQIGPLSRLREFVVGPASQAVIFFISVLGEKLRYTPQQILMGSAFCNLIILGAIYIVLRLLDRKRFLTCEGKS